MKLQTVKKAFTMSATLCLSFVLCSNVQAGDWEIPNYDQKGSRAIPNCKEPNFTKKALKNVGLEKKWGFPSSDPSVIPSSVGHIFTPPVIKKNIIYVADSKGYMRAIDRDGKQLWQTCAIGINPVTLAVDDSICNNPGVPYVNGLSSPITVTDDAVYAGSTTKGILIALKLDGTPKWTTQNSVPIDLAALAPFSVGIVAGITEIDGKVIFALNPTGDTGATLARRKGVGSIVAVNASNGALVWQKFLAPDISAADKIANPNALSAVGPGTFALSFGVSKKHGLLYIGTSQVNEAPTPEFCNLITQPPYNLPSCDHAPNEDAIIALKLSDGSKVWQIDTRNDLKNSDNTPVGDDIWTSQVLFNVLKPIDMDVGEGVAVFTIKGKEYVGVGTKMGIFYVADAKNGKRVNGKGLNTFPGSGYPIFPLKFPTVGFTGGFQVDSGYFKGKGEKVIHFGTLLDTKKAYDNLTPPLNNDQCRHPNYVGADKNDYPVCPGTGAGTGHIVLIKGDGSEEVCRYSRENTTFFSPIYVQGMILATAANSGKLHIIDTTKCVGGQLSDVIPPVDFVSSPTFGTSMSLSNGRIYAGDGFNIATSPVDRLVSLGLKVEKPNKTSNCNTKCVDDNSGEDEDK